MWRVFLCCTVRKYGRHESHYYGLDLTKTASTGCSGCDRQAANHPKGRPSADDQCGRNESERLKCFVAQVLCVGTWEDSMPNAEGVRLEKFQTHSHPPQLPVAQSGLPVRVGFDPKQHQQAVLGATDRQRIIQKEGLVQTISVDGMRVRGWNVYIYRYISLSIYCEPNDAGAGRLPSRSDVNIFLS